MRVQLGWLTYLLAVGFAGGLILSLVGNAWFGVSGMSATIGFFGFGIPMLTAGLGTAILWSDQEPEYRILGRTSTIMGLACGVCLFVLVAGWVLSNNKEEPMETSTAHPTSNQEIPAGILQFLGFGVSALACGACGIYVLLESERGNRRGL